MRVLLTIAAALAWQATTLPPQASANPSQAGEQPVSCCCCGTTTHCDCGCNPPASQGDAPDRPGPSLCPCDDLPAAPFKIERPHVTGPDRPTAEHPISGPGERPEPHLAGQVPQVAHSPPPDLSRIRTFILLD